MHDIFLFDKMIPMQGCSSIKKKDTFGTGLQNTKLSILNILLASTDGIESGTTPGRPLEPGSE